MINKVIKAIENKGYKAEKVEITKNGVKKTGITFGSDAIRPTLYIDGIAEGSIDEIADELIKTYEKIKKPDIDTNVIISRDFILDNAYVCLQRTGNENIIKGDTEFEGIERYIRVIWGDNSYKVRAEVLENADISIDEIWNKALENTLANVKIESMAKVIARMSGMPEEFFSDMPMAIISNKTGVNGASGIICRCVLEEYAKANNTNKVYVLPSSIHECILIPYIEGMDIDALTEMVREVNGSEVSPEEQLSDRAYEITF